VRPLVAPAENHLEVPGGDVGVPLGDLDAVEGNLEALVVELVGDESA
jgi:hypothetical protein